MPIEGPIRELGLTDLLQLLHLSRKSGTLTVRAARGEMAGRLELDRGAVVGVRRPAGAPRLGELLVLAGKATQGQVERALAGQGAPGGPRLGALLVGREGVPRADVERQLRFQVEEGAFDLLRRTEGDFHFEETPLTDPGPVPIRISTEGLLLESLRRVDEWSALASAPPDTDLVPALVEGDAATGSMLSLQPAEWEVLGAVDGERTLRAIAGLLGRAEFDLARAVFALVAAGVVELGHRRGDRLTEGETPNRERAIRAAELAPELRKLYKEEG